MIDAKQVHLNLYASDPEYREEYDRLEAEFQGIREALKMRDEDRVETKGRLRAKGPLKTFAQVQDKTTFKPVMDV